MQHTAPAKFVEALQGSGCWEEEWGFVIYRATFEDDDAWEKFKETFHSLTEETFSDALRTYSNQDEMRVAQRFWKCRFIDDRALEGKDIEKIREHYEALRGELTWGLQLGICLVATKDVLDSVKNYPPLSDDTGRSTTRNHPFVKVLYRSSLVDDVWLDEETDEQSGYLIHDSPKLFNAAIYGLIDELFPIVARADVATDKLDPGDDKKVWVAAGWEQDIAGGSG
ncbi:hypothetical protein P153DRAFT_380591 [Dothidotthia symphoricarpi CBS 119687]|uniref:Uncharacterized protein n=1 Tax=Dothidotthia symphoricarpi CBS 119687 TaxID=1392245 RepID=A0A6A6ASZ0_9PLEO|nr:uncharacterized protein P153DRAFT_380591 [Dothidotthia symphoricarpi CBS 119687]KAF2134780.1 hypothetical protein P153DRAFT_380591 [Dothidotthia symphoricarpi CBS 119687]